MTITIRSESVVGSATAEGSAQTINREAGVRHRTGSTPSHHHPLRRLLGVALLAGAALSAGAFAADAPAKPASSCVACHTDSAKLQEEAKGLPVPAASALQAGKG